MNVSIKDTVEINQKGRTSKYRWLCAEIEKIKGTGKWLVIDELESLYETQLLKSAAHKYFHGIETRTRKYDEDGRLSPSISFRLEKGL